MLIDKFLAFYASSSFVWFLVEIILVLVAYFLIKEWKNSFAIFFESMYEKAYDFFVDILWKDWKIWTHTYVVSLFFIILFSNLLWIILEIIAPIFWTNKEGGFILENYISIPSWDINFNLSLAIISILVILFVQSSSLWVKHFLYDYFPVFWKGYLTVEKEWKSKLYYYPLSFFVKTFDIILSLFLWLLEIIWLVAKIISLSFRLFWNMTSWTVLLAMTVVWLSSFTSGIIWFNFPVWLPILIYLQEILVALIQALVFPLLIAISIKVAMSEAEKA